MNKEQPVIDFRTVSIGTRIHHRRGLSVYRLENYYKESELQRCLGKGWGANPDRPDRKATAAPTAKVEP